MTLNNTKFKPFGTFAAPFKIGLNLLSDAELFQPDSNFEYYLDEKNKLLAEKPDSVFMAEPDTIDAQNEVLKFIISHVIKISQQKTNHTNIPCPVTPCSYVREEYADRPLVLASLLVQEDLVIMRRKSSGWHLVAAVLCFPSSWNLAEKFGRPLADIHQPVPGANENLDPMIHRIFDNLSPKLPVWRENWSVYGDANLRHDPAEVSSQYGGEHSKPDNAAFIRKELQTLHKLPASRDILFTIKIMVEPLDIIAEQQNAGEVAQQLLTQIDAMTDEQRRYKGFDQDMEHTRNYLQSMVSSAE